MFPLIITTVLLLWASAFVVIGKLVPTVDPMVIAALRNLVASLIFLGFRAPSIVGDSRAIFQEAKVILPAGILGVAGYNLLLNTGQTHVDPATASFLINTVPIFTLLGALLLKWEKLTHAKGLAFLVCMAGATVVALSGGSGGDKFNTWTSSSLLVIGAAICQSAYFLLVKSMAQRLSPLRITMGAICLGATVLLIFSFDKIFAHTFTDQEIWSLVYLGVGPSAIAFLLWSHVLKNLDAGIASIFLFAVPLVALAMEYFISSKMPSENTLIGCGIILGGLIILKYKEIYSLIVKLKELKVETNKKE